MATWVKRAQPFIDICFYSKLFITLYSKQKLGVCRCSAKCPTIILMATSKMAIAKMVIAKMATAKMAMELLRKLVGVKEISRGWMNSLTMSYLNY